MHMFLGLVAVIAMGIVLFRLRERKGRRRPTAPMPQGLGIAIALLQYLAIWIVAPMLLGLLGMLVVLHVLDDGSLGKKLVIGVMNEQYDWVQSVWIGNATQKVDFKL